tara:strand:- start:125 stop:427 length:303 start_codon:yes stop_codon:yes gene_type:complete
MSVKQNGLVLSKEQLYPLYSKVEWELDPESPLTQLNVSDLAECFRKSGAVVLEDYFFQYHEGEPLAHLVSWHPGLLTSTVEEFQKLGLTMHHPESITYQN